MMYFQKIHQKRLPMNGTDSFPIIIYLPKEYETIISSKEYAIKEFCISK